MDRAAIIGVGMTKIEANTRRDTFADMVWEAVNVALDDAGMTIDDVDNVESAHCGIALFPFDARTLAFNFGCNPLGDLFKFKRIAESLRRNFAENDESSHALAS